MKTNCVICQEETEGKELASIDGCNHKYHFGCIEKWAARENKCPLCRERFRKITKTVMNLDRCTDTLPTPSMSMIRARPLPVFAGRSAARLLMDDFMDRDLLSDGDSDDDSDMDDLLFDWDWGGLDIEFFSNGPNSPEGLSMRLSGALVELPRSYATNSADQTAGRTADNPLIIE